MKLKLKNFEKKIYFQIDFQLMLKNIYYLNTLNSKSNIILKMEKGTDKIISPIYYEKKYF